MEPNKTVASVVADAAEAVGRTNAIPNHVSAWKEHPAYWADCHKLGVRINGIERKKDVVEFNVDEEWALVHVRDTRGRLKKERGKWVTIRIQGKIEPFFQELNL